MWVKFCDIKPHEKHSKSVCYRVTVKRNYIAVFFLFVFFFYSGGINRFQ